MILSLKSPKNSPPKFLDTINSYRKLAGYKINLQTSLPFLYSDNEQTEKEYVETIPFIIALPKNQIPRSKFNKDVNDLYKENYKLLKKEIKEDHLDGSLDATK
jgi:hypothetical protein